jgi:TRAP-type C4-dicarboxylate transport system permease small subunit
MKNSPKPLFEEWLMAAILVILVVLVCAGVLSRYVFNWSFSFTEELTRYLLIWLACLGFSAGVARGETIQFQWPNKNSARLKTLLRWIGILTGSLFSLILLGSSIQNICLQWRYHQPTSVMGWPIVWVSVALPVAAILYLLRSIPRFRRNSNPE